MTNLVVPLIAAACLAFAPQPPRQGPEGGPAPQGSGWKAAVARVHARFGGRPGTFAHFGDSITDTLAFWTPLRYRRKAAPPEMERAYRRALAYLRPECWRDWKGPEHGNLRNYLVLMKYAEVLDALAGAPSAANSMTRAWYPVAPPLPSPTGDVLVASQTEGLFEAAKRVRPGGTILLEDGVYPMTRTLVIATDGVTLRGKSGRRERVVLDGAGTLGEGITIRACSGVTIADLTVRNIRWNGIKLDSETGVQRVTVRNCILHNVWQRGFKGLKVPQEGREKLRPRDCRIEYCLFANDRPKRFQDDPADTPNNFKGNYIGGIDVMFVAGWSIRDNVFVGIRGRTGEARGAVFLWHDARDCVIERNIIVDCDSGICLGNSHKPDDVAVHCTNMVVRNNFVSRAPENGILADHTRGCAILNNTVQDPSSRQGRLIRIVHDNDGLEVANNLLSGPPPRIESASKLLLRNNLSGGDLTGVFVSAGEGNLRLTAAATMAIDRALPLPRVTTDIDRRPRGAAPDLGAHEFEVPGSQVR